MFVKPMPPWSPLLGHLYFCYKISAKLPRDAHPNYLPDMIRRELPDLGPIYYLDTWPFGPQMLIVASARGLHQITQEHSLPKYHAMREFLRPISGGMDIVTMEGNLWKTWRAIFNPGFSASHLMSLTSTIVGETQRFCEILKERSNDKKTFKMKDLTDNLTMDIIGRVVLYVPFRNYCLLRNLLTYVRDNKLNSQRRSNPLVDGLRMQIRWLTFGADVNPFVRYNPIRPLVHWYNSRRMNNYVRKEIDDRFATLQRVDDRPKESGKSIIDLVLTAYLSEDPARKTKPRENTFKDFTMAQIKLFLFSGHDTTSSTVAYLFYTLASKPPILARIRAEHDAVLGPNAPETAQRVASNPLLLNQLPFTTAVIKETLRLYPAVSSTRAGEPNFHVVDDSGRQYPTNGLLVWANPLVIHRDPAYWPQPDEFIAERWLVAAEDRLHPLKGAWRPFEHGPRNCIGQELAMIEMKVIMVMTSRSFDFSLAYKDLDGAKASDGINTVHGERGYQIQRAQPSDDLPCQVSLVVN